MSEPTNTLYLGDCLDVLATLPPDSIDTCITDPPYGLKFMGKQWDHGVPGVPFWEAVLRVLKPGGHLLAFGGTRTYHRQTCAVEDAGFETRDCIQWLYGTGMPKSHNLSKAMDKAAGAAREVIGSKAGLPGYREGPTGDNDVYGAGMANGSASCVITAPATENAKLWDGWGTGLGPGNEPIVVALKPLDGTYVANALKHGVAGLHIDGARIPSERIVRSRNTSFGGESPNVLGGAKDEYVVSVNDKGRWPKNVILSHSPDCGEQCAPGCPVRLLDEQSGVLKSGSTKAGSFCQESTLLYSPGTTKHVDRKASKGGASRFYYTAKPGAAQRDLGLEGWHQQATGFPMRSADKSSDSTGGDATKTHRATKRANVHPTVKPIEIMRYLMRLTATPTGGIVLDPFMGSGTTGMAAALEGRSFVGVEKESKYMEIARARIAWARKEAGYDTDTLLDAIKARLQHLRGHHE